MLTRLGCKNFPDWIYSLLQKTKANKLEEKPETFCVCCRKARQNLSYNPLGGPDPRAENQCSLLQQDCVCGNLSK